MLMGTATTHNNARVMSKALLADLAPAQDCRIEIRGQADNVIEEFRKPLSYLEQKEINDAQASY